MRNAKSMETGVLSEVTCKRIRDLAVSDDKFDFRVKLQAPRPTQYQMATFVCSELELPMARKFSCFAAKSARASKCEVACANDVVIMTPEGGRPMLGQPWFLAEAAQEPRALVATFPITEVGDDGTVLARVQTNACLCPL